MTIKDLAARTGYAVATVSRVLNGHPNVSQKARQVILAEVERSGFQLNANAKQLKQQRATSLLVVVKGTSNELFARLVEHIQSLAAQTRYPVCVDYLDEEENEVRRALQLCWEKKPLGILFLGGNTENFRQDFGKIDIPCVVLTNDMSSVAFGNLSSVSVDSREASRCVIHSLAQRNHRHIVLVGGDRVTSDTGRQRYQGCLEGFREAGIDFDEELDYVNVRYCCQGGYMGAKTLLERGRKFTALYAAADVMAIGAIRALKEAGLRVPEDVSVVGFDGLEIGSYLVPQLTTVVQPVAELANRSMQILLACVEEGGEARHETVPFALNIRESITSI